MIVLVAPAFPVLAACSERISLDSILFGSIWFLGGCARLVVPVGRSLSVRLLFDSVFDSVFALSRLGLVAFDSVLVELFTVL